MSTFPIDLLTEILLLLPAKTLLRCAVVCKLWYHLIRDLHFVNLHLQRSLATKTNLHFVIRTPMLHLTDFDTFENIRELDYPFKHPEHGGVDVVGTCNGLLCLLESEYFQLIIYNPTTQTNRLLPWLPVEEQLAYPHGRFNFGFGFDTVSQDYKCVRIGQTYSSDPDSYYCRVMVYSFNNHSWRRGPDVPYFFYNHYRSDALLHETMHWVGAGSGDDRMPRPIVAFSLQDESFSSLTLPEFNAEHYSSLTVQVLDGCLCFLVSYLGDCDVWIMEEYGVSGSWKKLFKVVLRIFIEHVDRIICYSSSGKGLFVRISPLQVAYLDLETMETTNVKVADFFRCLDAHLCVENLLMLDHTNYVWQKRGQEEG
ncbi:F-box protein CPR1-like [Silene latifolia]|uniref:F-box protein CPR1-like n=1 Tax=Silene latifolia TaxID=37657 RepID=UPI003D77F5D4